MWHTKEMKANVGAVIRRLAIQNPKIFRKNLIFLAKKHYSPSRTLPPVVNCSKARLAFGAPLPGCQRRFCLLAKATELSHMQGCTKLSCHCRADGKCRAACSYAESWMQSCSSFYHILEDFSFVWLQSAQEAENSPCPGVAKACFLLRDSKWNAAYSLNIIKYLYSLIHNPIFLNSSMNERAHSWSQILVNPAFRVFHSAMFLTLNLYNVEKGSVVIHSDTRHFYNYIRVSTI